MGEDLSRVSRFPMAGEFALLARWREALSGEVPPGELHSGDDAAVLQPSRGRMLFATDLVVEGVHFDLSIGSAADAGWKVLAANVSDIAAMGGVPTHAVASVAAPPGADLDGLFEGLVDAAREYGVALVGGDLSASGPRAAAAEAAGAEAAAGRGARGGLVVSVAIVGETGEGRSAVTRGGAQPGDELWCTGPLGASAAGLARLRLGRGAAGGDEAGGAAGEEGVPGLDAVVRAYLRPIARPREGRAAAELGATAMIDVSDGLAADVGHLADESGVGIVLDHVPVAEGATEEQALGGGEDYELVFALPPGGGADEASVGAAFVGEGLRPPIRIGRCVADASERRVRDEPLPSVGWAHDVG